MSCNCEMSQQRDVPLDELSRKALDLIGRGKKASTGILQRELGIGYLDALRTLVLLERKGFVSQDGAELRETLLKSLEANAN